MTAARFGFAAGGGGVQATLDGRELEILAQLAEDLAGVVTRAASGIGGADDALTARLFPNARPDDDGAAAEFRALTGDDLASRKREDLVAVASGARLAARDAEADAVAGGTADAPGVVELDADAAAVWLRGLGTLRVALGERLGLFARPDAARDVRPTELGALAAFDWLGAMQDTLVRALDELDAGGEPCTS